MKPATLKALKGSIKKWEAIVDGTGADDASDNCPLCARFNPYESCARSDGEQCPVAIAGGLWCSQTPYEAWREAYNDRAKPFFTACPLRATDDETVMCAVLELEFLRDLLPKRGK